MLNEAINNFMESDKSDIEALLLELEIDSCEENIKKNLNFIGNMKSESIQYNKKRLADLFCRTITKIEKKENISEITNIIIKAFSNINKVTINDIERGNICILTLLTVLFNNRETQDSEEIDNLIDSGIIDLLDDLDKVSILFTLQDENNVKYFPIEIFLCKILDVNNFIRNLEKTSTIQALMFALQIFDKRNYPHEVSDILKIVDDYELEFVKYLYDGAIHCYQDWKQNYEKNGTLVLYNESKHTVLIRNNKKKYFDKNCLCSEYNISNIYEEKNSNKEIIAYYIKYDLNTFDPINIDEEFIKKGDKTRLIRILSLIYDYSFYNLIEFGHLINKNNNILPINPFSCNDVFCFINGAQENCTITTINKYLLDNYGLLKITGTGINYINIGTLVLLQQIFTVKIHILDLGYRTKTYNDLIINWIELCPNKQKSIKDFLNKVEEQLSFIQDPNDFFNKKYCNDFLLPLNIPLEITKKFELSSIINEGEIAKCKSEYDFFNDKYIITINDKDYSDFSVQNIDGDKKALPDGENFILLNEKEKKIIYDPSISLYNQLIIKLNEWNNRLLSSEIINVITETDISKLSDCMKMFKKSLKRIHKDIPLDSIVRYRLAYHILFLQLTPETYHQWIDIICKHDIIDFSKITKGKSYLNRDGVLYIPKNRASDQSTLKNLFIDYIRDPDDRNQIDIFDEPITYDGTYFQINHKKITEICFVFDIIQSGASSIGTIEYYFDETIQSHDPSYMQLCCNFQKPMDNKKKIDVITVNEIIEKNKVITGCNVSVLVFYTSKNGYNSVYQYLDEHRIKNIKIEPEFYINSVLSSEDKQIINTLYRSKLKGKINVGNFLCIREFNQPNYNIMSDELLEINRIIALFNRKG